MNSFLGLVSLLIVGFMAGVTTTTLGAGGGIALLALLSLFRPLEEAMVASSIALLFGNLHRAWLFRHALQWRRLAGCLVGVFVGSLVGGLLAAKLPEAFVRIAILVALLASAFAKRQRLSRSYSAVALFGIGVVLGGITALSGGIGILFAPLLLSMGLAGDRYVAAGVMLSVVAHVARLTAFGANGWLQAEAILLALRIGLGLYAGNLAGRAVRKWFTQASLARFEFYALMVVGGLALFGIAR